MKNNNEWVLHIDGDAFFASCEVIRKPELWGQAVVVGQERGIAIALTYAAKKIGIKRGDPVFKIKYEFPGVPILSSHFELYGHYARNLANLLQDKVESFEAYSIDECFATLHGTQEEVKKQVMEIKTFVQQKLGITYSFGLSINKTLAKVASKKNKPNGICFLMEDREIDEVLKTTDVENIWGIGLQTQKKLKVYKVNTAYDFATCDLRKILKKDFIKTIEATQMELQKIKVFEVGKSNAHQKSLQSSRSFIKKTNKKIEIISELARNIEVACRELREKGLYSNCCTIYVKRADVYTKTLCYDLELKYFTQFSLSILKNIEQMFDKFESVLPGIYKASGIYMHNLEMRDDLPQDLFNEQETASIEEEKITSVIDSIRHKFGFTAIQVLASCESTKRRKILAVNREKVDNYIGGLPFAYLGEITSG